MNTFDLTGRGLTEGSRRARRAVVLPAIALGAGLLLALTGCVPTQPSKTSADPSGEPTTPPATIGSSVTPTPEPSATPTPTPTPTPTASVDPNILFTISATAVAPNGAKVDLKQTVYKPTATTANLASDKALLNKQCTGWQSTYPTPQFVTAEISSKLQPGSVAWPKNSQVGVDMNGYPGWSGNYTGFQALCATVIVTVGGHIHGVIPVPGTNSADAKNGWARVEYGFATVSGDPDETTPKPGELHLTNCAISLGATAKTTSAIAPKWATQAQQYPGGTCRFGVGF